MSQKPEKPIASFPRIRRFNLRFASIFLAVLIACGGLIHAIRVIQLERNAKYILRRAHQLSEQGDVRAALRDYSHYLRFRPDDIDALSDMGQLLEETAVSYEDRLQAYLTYERVLRQDSNRDDVRRRIVDIALTLPKFSVALAHLKYLQRGSPNDPENFFEIGQCYEGSGAHAAAAEEYVKAIEQAPGRIEFYKRLVRLLLIRGKKLPLNEIDPIHRGDDVTYKQVAEYFMDEVVDKGRPVYEAFLARARFRKNLGQLERAAQDMDQALELAGDKPDVLLSAADLSLVRAQVASAASLTKDAETHFNAATKSARNGRRIDPADLRFFLILSRIELARDRQEEAVVFLRDGIERYQTIDKTKRKQTAAESKLLHNQLLFSLADLLITLADSETGQPDAKRLTEAKLWIAQLPGSGPLKALAHFLNARMLIVDQRWLKALAVLQSTEAIPVPLTNLRRRISLETARCYERLRSPDAQLDILRRTLSREPLWMEGRIAVAAALAGGNRIDDAINEYSVFLEVPGVPTTVVRLMMLKELARPVDRRDWTDVETVLGIAARVMKDSPEVPALQAELLAQQQNFVAAQSVLTTARGLHPEDIGVQTSSALLELKRSDRNTADRLAAAETILDDAEKAIPGDHVEFRLARAEIAALKEFDDAIAELAKLEQNSKRLTNSDRYQLLSGLARVYTRIGSQVEARRVWTQLSELYPQNLLVRLVLLQFATDAGDELSHADLLREVRRIEGADGPNGNYEEAAAILNRLRQPKTTGDKAKPGQASQHDKLELDRARSLLVEAARVRPTWPAVPRALGLLEDIAGNSDEAFQQFQRAVFLGDHSREVVARVVRGLFLRKRYNEADNELLELQNAQPDVITGDIARLAWRVAWQRRQFDRAIGIADGVAKESGDFRDMIWKAQLNFARGRRDAKDVEKPLTKATADEKGSQSPVAWFALVAYFNRVGRIPAAKQTIAAAEKTLPKHLGPLTAGRCFEMLGETQQAEERYLKALQHAPNDVSRLITLADFYTRQGDSKKAGPYLEKILAPETSAPEFAKSWARRRRALLLAGRGGYDSTARALAALERIQNDEQPGSADAINNLRAKALLLSSNQNRRDRQAAIAVYEEIARRQKLSSAERFRLAQLYDLTGNWDEARDLILDLTGRETPDGSHVAYYVLALVRRENLGDAQNWFETLKRVEPDTFRTMATHARLLAALDRSAEAVPLLTDYLSKRRAAAESLGDLLAQQKPEQVLGILESFLRDQLNQQGIKVIVQARELLQQKQSSQAISLLTEYIDDNKLAAAAPTALYRLSASLCEEIGQLKTAEDLFAKYTEVSDNPRAVFLHATFLARHARLDEALALCREVRPDVDPELLIAAAVSVVGHGQPSKAQLLEVQSWANEILNKNPNSSAASIAMGDLHLVQRSFGDAEADYRRLLKRNKINVAALNNLAWLLAYEKRNLAEADQLIRRAIRQAGPVAALLDTRAMIHLAAGRPTQAIDDLTEAFVNTVSPFSALGHLHLAEAYLQAGDLDASQKMLARAKQYGLSIEGLHPLEREKYNRLTKSHTPAAHKASGLRPAGIFFAQIAAKNNSKISPIPPIFH